jgi:hypothetical protein
VQRAILGGVSELDLDYRGSSLAEDHRAAVTGTRWRPGRDDERADAVDQIRFARGVRAGDRAPDGTVQDAATGQPGRLFDAFRGPQSTLLLFDGEARTVDGYTTLAGIADGVERLFGPDVRPWVVVWGRQLPTELAGRRVLLDPDGETHRRYGATAEALYLVRPDGHVGLRAQPASEEVLVRYLGRVFDRSVPAPRSRRRPPRRRARGEGGRRPGGVRRLGLGPAPQRAELVRPTPVPPPAGVVGPPAQSGGDRDHPGRAGDQHVLVPGPLPGGPARRRVPALRAGVAER